SGRARRSPRRAASPGRDRWTAARSAPREAAPSRSEPSSSAVGSQIRRGGQQITGGVAGRGLCHADTGAAQLFDALGGDRLVLGAVRAEPRGGLQRHRVGGRRDDSGHRGRRGGLRGGETRGDRLDRAGGGGEALGNHPQSHQLYSSLCRLCWGRSLWGRSLWAWLLWATAAVASGLTSWTKTGVSLSGSSSMARPAGSRLNRWPRLFPLSCGLPDSIRVVACSAVSRRSSGAVITAWADPVARAVTITRKPRSPASASSPIRFAHGRWPTNGPLTAGESGIWSTSSTIR